MTTATDSPRRGGRVPWLDGVRAIAALYVVLHHTWLMVWPAFPVNNGPAWTGVLVYGQFAVALFIVVSGYSLTLRPASHAGELLGGSAGFFRGRARRILPPYWAALAISTLLLFALRQFDPTVVYSTKSVVVHALLLQDLVQHSVINGTFWSIAVECQIYILFPLVLLLLRRRGATAVVVAAAVLVVAGHAAASAVPVLHKFDDLTPQFFVLFVLGVVAARRPGDELPPRRRRWLGRIAASSVVALVLGRLLIGPVRFADHFFWADMLVGIAVAAWLAMLGDGALPRVRRALASRPLALVGAASYSIYLIHAPILRMFWFLAVRPADLSPVWSFLVLLLVGVPATLVACAAFFLVCERPFLRPRAALAGAVEPAREQASSEATGVATAAAPRLAEELSGSEAQR